MKNIRTLMAGLMLFSMLGAFAQVTNELATNAVIEGPAVVDNEGEPKTVVFPQDKGAIWLAIIPPLTFTITWLLGKIPKLPNQLLPWLTPVAGIVIGQILDVLNAANFAWYEAGAAGTIAVFIYEGIKDVAVKQGEPSALKPTRDTPNDIKRGGS